MILLKYYQYYMFEDYIVILFKIFLQILTRIQDGILTSINR